nr:DNA-directed DNA polymerase [Tanacetum cinerariifolium]
MNLSVKHVIDSKIFFEPVPIMVFLELHQLDTFYHALNSKDQDSLNSAAGGNFLDKIPRECLAIIESKSKVCYSRDKPVVSKVSTNASTFGVSPNVAELKDMVKALLLDKKGQNQSPAPMKAVEESCVTYGEATKDTVNPTNNRNTKDVQPQAVQLESPVLISEPAIALVSASKPNQKASIPYPSRRNDERNREKANNQIEKFFQIFKDMSFEISFADALILMPKFASTLKALIGNKEKLSEMARTPLNKHCSIVLLKKLPKKLGDPGKFLIPCDFPGMAECLALADLGASINLMLFSLWKRLYLPDLTPTCMTLELAYRSISRPVGIAEDVYVKVGSFHFLADFVVVDFDADPRVPLILRRSFLKTERDLIDVFKGELTLRVGKEAITFNLDQTSRYSSNYSDMTAKRIDVIDMACKEYSQEVLGFYDTILSVNPTSYYDSIVSATSSTLTPGGHTFLKAFLNDDPSLPPPNQRNYLPGVRKELKICEAKSDKSSVDKPLVVKLKVLPPHLEYALLEGDDKLPVIIAKDLSLEEKTALITVLKSHNPWVSPVHCVPKKGGFTVVGNEDNEIIPTRLFTSWRVCIDYRKFNEATRKDHFPLPFMDQMLERLAGNQYYCFPNDFSSYFQIPIDLKDQEKTTFTCPYGTFAYHCMPFGLCNAPGIFQRNSFQSCLSHLERILKRCEDTNLCLNWEKSHFMVKEGIVLGHKISKQGIEVDKAKVDVISKLPHSTTVKAPILIALDRDMPFELMCDASDFTIGAVLGQRQDKHFRPILYASKTMTEAESNYTMTKKDMLAVSSEGVYLARKTLKSLRLATLDQQEVTMDQITQPERVLLFNSRLKIFSGKLKSHWSGLFTISQVYPYGTVELSQPDEPNFKVNGHRLKHYFGEDVPKLVVPNLQTFAKDH